MPKYTICLTIERFTLNGANRSIITRIGYFGTDFITVYSTINKNNNRPDVIGLET